jgi:hypothetical protein
MTRSAAEKYFQDPAGQKPLLEAMMVSLGPHVENCLLLLQSVPIGAILLVLVPYTSRGPRSQPAMMNVVAAPSMATIGWITSASEDPGLSFEDIWELSVLRIFPSSLIDCFIPCCLFLAVSSGVFQGTHHVTIGWLMGYF